MGRLIDADAFKNFIESLPKEPNGTSMVYDEAHILHFIDAQSTAYSVEKVVEELASNSRFIDDINEHNIKCISCVIGQKTAIDIVKRGGQNDFNSNNNSNN